MINRLHTALLDMADPARKLADALAQYHDSELGRIACGGTSIPDEADGIRYPDGFTVEALQSDASMGPIWSDGKDNMGSYQPRTVIDPAHAHLITGQPTDRAIMEDLQQRSDELLHAIDLARTTITGAIPLQTLDLVRGKVKDVLANLAGTIEKDM